MTRERLRLAPLPCLSDAQASVDLLDTAASEGVIEIAGTATNVLRTACAARAWLAVRPAPWP
jgi:hypothetical protein